MSYIKSTLINKRGSLVQSNKERIRLIQENVANETILETLEDMYRKHDIFDIKYIMEYKLFLQELPMQIVQRYIKEVFPKVTKEEFYKAFVDSQDKNAITLLFTLR